MVNIAVEPGRHVYEQAEQEAAKAAAAEYDDFDAFWRSRNPARPVRIRGVLVTPPTDVPLSLVDQLDRVMRAQADEQAIRDLLATLYGQGVVDQWLRAGMGMRELQVVVAWTGAHMRGHPISFEAAYKLVEQALTEREQGKGLNRAARRAAKRARGRTPSNAAGG